MYKKIIGIFVTTILLNMLGCSSSKILSESYIRPDTSLAHIRTIAVMPFEGKGRAERIRELTVTNLLSSGFFEVLDKGQVDSTLMQEGIFDGDAPIDLYDIKRLGNMLNVQAILFGTVEIEKQTRGSASFSVITITFRLIDTETGILLWQTSGKGDGYSYLDRTLGLRPKDDFVLTLELLNELFATLQ
jgi:TolB-like protein